MHADEHKCAGTLVQTSTHQRGRGGWWRGASLALDVSAQVHFIAEWQQRGPDGGMLGYVTPSSHRLHETAWLHLRRHSAILNTTVKRVKSKSMRQTPLTSRGIAQEWLAVLWVVCVCVYVHMRACMLVCRSSSVSLSIPLASLQSSLPNWVHLQEFLADRFIQWMLPSLSTNSQTLGCPGFKDHLHLSTWNIWTYCIL